MAPLKSVQLVACFPVSFVSSRGIEYKMQFFKTSYELLAPEYLPFIGHRDDIYALTPHFSRKKHYFARYFEQSREKKQKGGEKKKTKIWQNIPRNISIEIYNQHAASQWVVYPPLFSSLFLRPTLYEYTHGCAVSNITRPKLSVQSLWNANEKNFVFLS